MPFEHRLVAAPLCGDAAGWRRPRPADAALVVVAAGEARRTPAGRAPTSGSTTTRSGRRQLARLLDLSDLYFGAPQDVEPLDGGLAEEVGARLARLGYEGSLVERWAPGPAPRTTRCGHRRGDRRRPAGAARGHARLTD